MTKTRKTTMLMVNSSENVRTSRFKMKDLPSEVARVVEGLRSEKSLLRSKWLMQRVRLFVQS